MTDLSELIFCCVRGCEFEAADGDACERHADEELCPFCRQILDVYDARKDWHERERWACKECKEDIPSE